MTVGKDVFQAYYFMETMEHFAKISLVTRMLGHTRHLNEDEVQKLIDLRKKLGIVTPSTGAICRLSPNPTKTNEKKPDSEKENMIEMITEKVFQRLKDLK